MDTKLGWISWSNKNPKRHLHKNKTRRSIDAIKFVKNLEQEIVIMNSP